MPLLVARRTTSAVDDNVCWPDIEKAERPLQRLLLRRQRTPNYFTSAPCEPRLRVINDHRPAVTNPPVCSATARCYLRWIDSHRRHHPRSAQHHSSAPLSKRIGLVTDHERIGVLRARRPFAEALDLYDEALEQESHWPVLDIYIGPSCSSTLDRSIAQAPPSITTGSWSPLPVGSATKHLMP
jgi:hypothetical protein